MESTLKSRDSHNKMRILPPLNDEECEECYADGDVHRRQEHRTKQKDFTDDCDGSFKEEWIRRIVPRTFMEKSVVTGVGDEDADHHKE